MEGSLDSWIQSEYEGKFFLEVVLWADAIFELLSTICAFGQWLTIDPPEFFLASEVKASLHARQRILGISQSLSDALLYGGLRDEVGNRIRARIFSGDLRDGERIVERDLAAEMGTSRGPIRDALRMLEQEGLVVSLPRRGTRVTSLTLENAIEILAIREALEPVAVRFLIEQNRPEHFAKLESVVDQLDEAAKADDWQLAIRLDLDFHGLIFELAGQRRLLRIWESLRKPMLQLFGKLSHYYRAIDEVPARHRALLETIRSGELPHALAQSSDHVVAFRESLIANLAAKGPSGVP